MAVVRIVAASATGSAGELAMESEIAAMGHSVDIIDDADSVPGGVDVFVIMDTCATATLNTKYDALTEYVIWCKPGLWDDKNFTNGAATNPGSRSDLDLVGSHPIISGLADPLTYKVSGGGGGQWGIPAASGTICPGATALFQRNASPTGHIMGWYLPAGGALHSGVAAGPRAGMGPWIDSPLATIGPDGWDLFQRVLEFPLSSTVITVDTAVLSLASVTPAATGSDAATRTADTSALSLTGSTPTAAGSGAATATVDPAAATFTAVTPVAVGSDATFVTADIAALTLAGVEAAAESGDAPVNIAIDPAALSLEGSTPGATGTGLVTVTADSAELSLAGIDVALETLLTIAVDPADLSLAGINATAAGIGQAQAAPGPAVLVLNATTPGVNSGPPDIDITVIVGPTRVGTATVGSTRAGTATVGATRAGTASVAGTRVGTVEADDTRIRELVTVGVTRVGSVDVNDTRVGSVEVADTRTDRGA